MIIDGKALAKKIHAITRQRVETLAQKGKNVGFAAILVGDNPASQVYVRNKLKMMKKIGISAQMARFPVSVTQKEVADQIKKFNVDPAIDGILIQLPLPDHLNTQELIDIVDPNKDVDGLTAINAGKRGLGLRSLLPCTPKGCLKLIKTVKQDLSGLYAVIVGRSDLVGKPMAQLLLQENCTVTQTHSHTRNLEELCRQADILVVAVGQPFLVKKNWIKPTAIVIDVGINRLSDDHLVGDVDFAVVAEHVYAITPVPGGVGPMTIACLLENTVEAAESAYLNDNV